MKTIALAMGDYEGPSITHLDVPDDFDFEARRAEYAMWLRNDYRPRRHAYDKKRASTIVDRKIQPPEYLTFSAWLITNGYAIDSAIEVFEIL